MREYFNNQGRWMSPDPAGLAAVNPMNPQTWNRYAYVGGNPLSATDPSGLGPLDGIRTPLNIRPDTGGAGGVNPASQSSLAGLLDPGAAFINSAIQDFYVEAGLNSPVQQALTNYQAEVDDASNGTHFTQAPGYFTSDHYTLPGATISFTGVDTSGDSLIGYDWGSWTIASSSITYNQWKSNWGQLSQAYENGVAYIIALRSGMSQNDVRIQKLASQITKMVNHPMTPCEYGTDVPAVAGALVNAEGAIGALIRIAGVAGTVASWSVCK